MSSIQMRGKDNVRCHLSKYSCNVGDGKDCVVFIGEVTESQHHKETEAPLFRPECRYAKRYADAIRNAWRAS